MLPDKARRLYPACANQYGRIRSPARGGSLTGSGIDEFSVLLQGTPSAATRDGSKIEYPHTIGSPTKLTPTIPRASHDKSILNRKKNC